jgi:ribose transport system permease protein
VDNILNITRQVSLWAIVGVGMTFMFIAGEFDISVGSHFGFLVVVLVWLGWTVGVQLSIVNVINYAPSIGVSGHGNSGHAVGNFGFTVSPR